MKRFLGVALAVLVAGVTAVPSLAASGDDAAALKAALNAANVNVRSMQMQISSPMGMAGVVTVVRAPMRAHTEMTTGGPVAIEMYVADGLLYLRMGGSTAQWQKYAMPAAAANLDLTRTFADATHLTPAADVTLDGVKYGAFDLQMDSATIPGMAQPPGMKMNCTYDKATFLVHACKSDFMTEAFRYNDPSDVVVLPSELANAVDRGAFPFPTSALTSPKANATPDAATAALPDRAVSLVGTWSCESVQHSTGTWVFARTADDSITMKNLFRTATGLSGEWDDTYKFDAKTGRWMWTSQQANRPGSLKENGTAPRWTGDKWTFEGQEVLTDPPAQGSIDPQHVHRLVLNLRSVYTSLGPDAFRHDIEHFQNGTWVTGSASTCKRA